jgi:hypothetical protein
MRTMNTDFIPATAPHLLYEKAVPTAGPDYLFDPVIAGDLVLLTLGPYQFVSDRFIRVFAQQKSEAEHPGSGEQPVQHIGWSLPRRNPESVLPSPGYQGEPYPDQKTILQALDLRTGAERFSLSVPIQPAPRDVLPTLPGVTSTGTILQGLYQQDLFLHVYHIGPDGFILGVDRLYEDDRRLLSEVGLGGNDLSIKLTFSPIIPCADDAYLVSWLYRQVRFARLEYRRIGDPLPLWTGDEFWAGNTAEVVVGTTILDPDYRVVGRRLTDGTVLWSNPSPFCTIAGVDDALVLVAANPYVNPEGVYQPLPPDVPSLAAWDLYTGKTLWKHTLPGIVVSAQAGPTHIAAVAIDADGYAQLFCFSRKGDRLWSRHLSQSEPYQISTWDRVRLRYPPPSYPWPTLLAVDWSAFVLTIGTTLRSFSLQGRHRQTWQLSLPADVHRNQ